MREGGGRWGLLLCLAAALCLAEGCRWWELIGRREQNRGQKVERPTAGPPKPGTGASAQPQPTPAPAQPKLPPSQVARPGNPAAWGEGARIAVGRQFEPVYFERDGAELTSAARQQLADHAKWLQEHPRVWVTLAGHSGDEVSIRYGYCLGLARALAVMDFLVGRGLDQQRFYPISFGEDLPVADDPSPQSRVLNSRVELLGFIAPSGQNQPKPVPAEKKTPPPAEPQPTAPPAEDLAR